MVGGPAAADPEPSLTELYQEIAGQLIGAALTDKNGWDKAIYLTTQIGHRLSGSPQLERAIDWAAAQMDSEGLENVWKQPVEVPHWVRGAESLEMVSPVSKPLALLGLGGSVGTPTDGITAPLVVVESFDELSSLERHQVEGKIVLFAVPWKGYGPTREYRGRGASAAAEMGAVAALVRSATNTSIYSPHTGAMRYADDLPRIPAAAVTVEDAAWIRQLATAGQEVVVRLRMGAHNLPAADSANVIAEIVGSESPEEVVVMGGHYDSWDVGQGAHDDGVACIAAWQALTLIKQLGLKPRRTLRVVLWTDEEQGGSGSTAYHQWVGDAIIDHVAAIEMDGGAERPVGFGLGILRPAPEGGDPEMIREPGQWPPADDALAKMQEIGRLLDGFGAGEMTLGGGGADIAPLMRDGVPGLGLRTVGEHYFDWHHTDADTIDKVDPQDFRQAVAMLAVVGYVLADMPDRLVPPPAPSRPSAGSTPAAKTPLGPPGPRR
jgi:Zn-dependent M28 family amino/carboxypeptidase